MWEQKKNHRLMIAMDKLAYCVDGLQELPDDAHSQCFVLLLSMMYSKFGIIPNCTDSECNSELNFTENFTENQLHCVAEPARSLRNSMGRH